LYYNYLFSLFSTRGWTVPCIIIIFSVYFPQEVGLYPAVLFVPGLNGDVLAEVYETVLSRIASHGFFVFGLDYKFPIEQVKDRHNIQVKGNNLKEDINKFFQQYTWVCCVDLFLVNLFRKNTVLRIIITKAYNLH
jgi:hypothetical protein